MKFSGYVQWQSVFDDDADDSEHTYEARLQIDAKNDSEIGTIASSIRLTAGGDAADDFTVDRAYMTVGDGNFWTLGLIGSPWDFSIVGEQNFLDGGVTRLALGYTFAFDGGTFSLFAVDDQGTNATPDLIAKATFTAGDLGFVAAWAHNESQASANSVKVNATYMGFGAHVQWSEDGAGSGVDYLADYEWVAGIGYGFDATDKLNVALAADMAMDKAGVASVDDYALSANFTYQVAEGLSAAARLTHKNGDSYASAENELRLRLKRSF